MHRRRNPRPATVIADYRRQWLNRFTDAEIAEIAESFDHCARSLGLRESQLADPIRSTQAALIACASRR